MRLAYVILLLVLTATYGLTKSQEAIQKQAFKEFLRFNLPDSCHLGMSCLPSGKNLKDFSSKAEYLQDFAKGHCNPMIFLPGIMASKLTIQIHCERFFKNFNHIATACGWPSCLPLLGPQREYQIWIPGLTGNSTGFVFRPNGCFAKLMKLRINSKYPGDQISESSREKGKPWLIDTWKLGYRIVPYGFTKSRRKNKQSQCGFKGVKGLISGLNIIQSAAYMSKSQAHLENMGYVSGLTMQALPYDWRLHNEDDPVTQMIPEVLQKLHSFTNKKVVVIAHSMGNFRALNSIYKMSPDFKSKYLKRFISLAPPFMGVSKILKMMVCGNAKFQKSLIYGIKYGISPRGFARLFSGLESAFQLLPNFSISKNKSAPWVAKIRQRNYYEQAVKNKKNVEGLDEVFTWLPKPLDICYPEGDQRGNKFCSANLDAYGDFGYMGDQIIDEGSIERLLGQFSVLPKEHVQRGFQRLQKEFTEFQNPGVDTVLVYANVLKTERKFFLYHKDPKYKMLKNKVYCEAGKDFNTYKTGGDGSVDGASSVTPFLKWALEFDEGKTPGAKPVKIAEICSSWVDKESPFGTQYKTPFDDLADRTTNKNSYIGLGKCDKKNLLKKAGHSNFLWNTDVLDFIGEALMGEKLSEGLTPEQLNKLKEMNLDEYLEYCHMGWDSYQRATKNS